MGRFDLINVLKLSPHLLRIPASPFLTLRELCAFARRTILLQYFDGFELGGGNGKVIVKSGDFENSGNAIGQPDQNDISTAIDNFKANANQRAHSFAIDGLNTFQIQHKLDRRSLDHSIEFIFEDFHIPRGDVSGNMEDNDVGGDIENPGTKLHLTVIPQPTRSLVCEPPP